MRRPSPPALGPLLLLAGLLLTIASGEARIIQEPQAPPPQAAAETGGRKLPAAGPERARPFLAFDLACTLVAPLAIGACLGWQQGAMLARIAATDRLWLSAGQGSWRAPRLAGRQAALARAAAFDMRRRAWLRQR